MTVFINRTLNFKRIKAVGLDMDYTLVRYNAEAFEKLAYLTTIQKLLEHKKYPREVGQLKYEHHKVIQGLVIDRKRGNILKLSRFGKVKMAFHGLRQLDFSEQQKIYQQRVIDLSDEHIQSLDTNFSISNGVLYMDLVELKEKGLPLPDYKAIAEDVKEMIDLAHRDGSLKKEVQKNLATYIIQDPETVAMLERLRRYQKKLLLITNSDFEYTKLLLDYAVAPFLKDCGHWSELFDIVITFSMKPRFFTDKNSFLEIDLQSGMMSNHVGPVLRGIFQGGNAQQLQKDLGLSGDEILYIGDHIYGDVVSIKKTFNWRTALVLEQLQEEMQGLQTGAQVQQNIDDLMERKSKIELQLNHLYTEEYELKKPVNKKQVDELFDELEKLNVATSNYIMEYQKGFNKYWGELMRAGQEESRFAGQVEKYACLYMIKISDLMNYSPRSYFRPLRRVLPHERGFLSWN